VGRDGVADIKEIVSRFASASTLPLVIDSTEPPVLQAGLELIGGRPVVNSVNYEDGDGPNSRFARIMPLVKEHGTAVIALTIDEQGQARTTEGKVAIASRLVDALVGEWGMRVEDIIVDCLTFPVATGQEETRRDGIETIEAIRQITTKYPGINTTLGVSNVSFGLNPAARMALNSVFLHEAVQAGLTSGIIDAAKIVPLASLPEEQRKVALDLVWDRREYDADGNVTYDPLNIMLDMFAGVDTAALKDQRAAELAALPTGERLQRRIIDGEGKGLEEDLDLARSEGMTPLGIINDQLLEGMKVVGERFGAGEMQLPFVLQSAEVMKNAVALLEPHMEKSDSSGKGTMVIATVRGDVHDIGKNLVDIIFSNNGYTVINLGIKVPPEQLIEAAQEHRPDVIGLSGLLVKSAQQMVVTAGDLRDAGVELPLLVGGAALSDRFTRGKIAPSYEGTVVYCNDAMNGLDTLNKLMDPELRKDLEARLLETAPAEKVAAAGDAYPETEERSSRIAIDVPVPAVPDTERHVEREIDLDLLWSYVNPQMLFGKHLGFRGRFVDALAAGDVKAQELLEKIDAVKVECRAGAMQAHAVWQFFEAESEGNRIHIFGGEDRSRPIATFAFPRQRKPDGVSLSDLVLPPVRDAQGRIVARDHIGVFVTTAGAGIRELASRAKDAGEYLRSYALQALALETAEAGAEYVHASMRAAWGFADPPELSRKDVFQARYRGKRYSFGYPACPDLESQALLFQLVRPEEIGVELTEGFMMEPEASVSALVFHHPSAAYFSVGATGDGDE
jgi:5-methyltetrahydrofolate--homocysteine methyltransferase